MGQPISYCATCGIKIKSRDFDIQTAFRFEGRAYCRSCASGVIQAHSPDRKPEVQEELPASPSVTPRRGAPTVGREKSTRRGVPPSDAAPAFRSVTSGSRSSTPLILAVAGIGTVVVILLVAALSGGSGAAGGPSNTPAAPTPGPEPRRAARPVEKEKVPETVEAESLRRIREFCLRHPKKFSDQIAKYEKLLPKLEGTPWLAQARKDLEHVRRLAGQSMENELVSIREEAKRLSDQEEYQPAMRVIEQARTRHSDAGWERGIERALEDVHANAEKRLETVKEEAGEARRRGNEKEINGIRERVARWTMPKLRAKLDAFLAALPPVRDLVPGDDISAWSFKKTKWTAKDGVLMCPEPPKGNRQVATRETFGEFHLTGQVYVETRGYFEIQVWSYARVAGKSINPGWRSFKVVARKKEVEMYLDGQLLKKWTTPPERTSGKLAFFATVPCRIKELRLALEP